MTASEKLQQLHRQRNIATVAAILVVIVGMAVCLPQALQRRQQLKTTNDRLLDLQARIQSVQGQIRDVQTRIVQVQGEIAALQKEHR